MANNTHLINIATILWAADFSAVGGEAGNRFSKTPSKSSTVDRSRKSSPDFFHLAIKMTGSLPLESLYSLNVEPGSVSVYCLARVAPKDLMALDLFLTLIASFLSLFFSTSLEPALAFLSIFLVNYVTWI